MDDNSNMKFLLPGWKTVWAIYSFDNLFRSTCLPLILSVVSFLICLFSGKQAIDFILYISEITTSIGPSILGFTLSGYAILMGLSNSEFIKGMMTFREEGKEYTIFQSLNSTFAVVLFASFVTTMVAIIASLIVKSEIAMPKYLISLSDSYNWSCLFIMIFLLFYTINSIKDIVINIFNFGQYAQSCIDDED